MSVVAIFGARGAVFVLLSAVLLLCGWLGGVRLAGAWSGSRRVFAYAVLLALFHRFLVYALAEGALLSAPGFFVSLLLSLAVFFAAWRAALAAKMASQYPWLWRRRAVFFWHPQDGAPGGPPGGA